MTNRPLYALSLQEPWWWAILNAGKDIENRRWPFPWGVNLPQRIVIHTSKTVDERGLVLLHESPEVKRLCLIPPSPSSLRLWRVLLMVVKTKLEMVAAGLDFAREFFPFIVLPDGHTVADHALPQVMKALETGGGPPALLPRFDRAET